jgi:hypothetical protein
MTCRICHAELTSLWEYDDGLCDHCSKQLDADLVEVFGEANEPE